MARAAFAIDAMRAGGSELVPPLRRKGGIVLGANAQRVRLRHGTKALTRITNFAENVEWDTGKEEQGLSLLLKDGAVRGASVLAQRDQGLVGRDLVEITSCVTNVAVGTHTVVMWVPYQRTGSASGARARFRRQGAVTRGRQEHTVFAPSVSNASK